VFRDDVLDNLKALLPPPERRGLLMVDPSYEVEGDYYAIPNLLEMANKRFTTGVFALWYPVLQRAETEKLVRRVVNKVTGEWLRAELCVRPDANRQGMTGSGMLVLRPPFGLQDRLAAALPVLQHVLQVKGGGSVILDLVGRSA
jgi:23S rRNA (adenine2030-N6)-methyltransferase